MAATLPNLYDVLQQIYQGTAQTAGPYANLAGATQPYYGQLGAQNLQGSLFGYNNAPGQVSSAATPYGGFFGGPQQASAVGANPYGPQSPAGSGVGQTPVGLPGVGTGYGGSSPTTNSTTGGTYGNNGLYNPPSGSLIGLGPNQTFNDPYANVGAQQPSYQPGSLDLNTTGLSAFGPLATGSLLQSNPYLGNALGYQAANLSNAYNTNLGPSPLLGSLNQAAGGLDLSGSLNQGQLRDASQGALANFGASNTSHGNSAIGADLLSRYNAQQAEQNRNFGLASGVQGLNFQQAQQQLAQQGLVGNLGSQAGATATVGVTNPIMQLLFPQGGQSSSPSNSISDLNSLISPSTTLGADVTGFNANATSAQNIANANNSSALTSGLLGIGGSVLSGIFSDERLKKNIKKVGESPSGIPEYEWQYKTDKKKRRYHGTTAQALEFKNPYAVIEDPVSGIKAVDYDKTDVSFFEVNPYRKAA